MTQAVGKGFDEYLLTPDFFADPYPFYHQLRSTQPVYWSDRLGAWLLTRYTDVASALHDSRLKSGSRIQAIMSQLPETVRSETQPLYQHLTKMMAFTDPPNHTRLRTLVGKAFTPGTVAKLRPRIQACPVASRKTVINPSAQTSADSVQ